MKTWIVAVQLGDAIDRFRADRCGEPAREDATIAVEEAPPQRGVCGFAGEIVQIACKISERSLQRCERSRVPRLQSGLAGCFRCGKDRGEIVASCYPGGR